MRQKPTLLYRRLPHAVKRAGGAAAARQPGAGLPLAAGAGRRPAERGGWAYTARAATARAASRPTGAPPVPAEPLAPARFSGQAAATHQRRGGRCQGWRARLLRATRRAWPLQEEPAKPLYFHSAWPGWGLCRLGAPGGGRERWPRPQPAQAARGLRLEREAGDGAEWAGGFKLSQGAARSPWKATQEPATRARRPSLRAALRRTAPLRGLGVRGTNGTGEAGAFP